METLNITTSIAKIIQERRSIFPHSYNGKTISKEVLTELLEQANYAPTHRLTEPWRFKVIGGEKRDALGNLLAELYKNKVGEENMSALKYKKTAQKPGLCSHVIAICMQRDPEERIPEWEEVASVAMAVQNIWLAGTAEGIGMYWSSPSTIASAACREFLNLKEGERCLGFLFMGYHDLPVQEAKRTPMAEKVEWL